MLRFSEWLLENKSGNVNNPDGINQYTFSPEQEKKMTGEEKKELKDIEDSINSGDFSEEELKQLQQARIESIKKIRTRLEQSEKVENNKYLSDEDKKEFDKRIKEGTLKPDEVDDLIEKKENELRKKDFDKWYGKRKEEREEYWKDKKDGSSQLKTMYDDISLIFSRKNFEKNEEKLKKYGLTDNQIKKLELYGMEWPKGGPDLTGKKFNGKRHYHIKDGIMKQDDEVIIFFKEGGEIDRIGTHKQLGIKPRRRRGNK